MFYRGLSSSCRATCRVACRVAVEFPVELSRPGLKRVRRRPSNRCQRTTRPAAGVRPPTGAVPAGPRGRYRLGTARVDRYVPRTTGASHMAPARRTTPPADRGGLGGRRRAARGLPPVSPAGLPPVSHRPIFKDRSPTARARTHTAFFFNTSTPHPHNVRPTPAGAAARACGAPRNPSAPLRRVPRRALEAQYPGVTPIDLIDGCVDEWCV